MQMPLCLPTEAQLHKSKPKEHTEAKPFKPKATLRSSDPEYYRTRIKSLNRKCGHLNPIKILNSAT